MTALIIAIIVIVIVAIAIKIKKSISQKHEQVNKKLYKKKSKYITDIEKYFFDIINNNFNSDYLIFAQIPLSSVVIKNKEYKNQYQNELYRTIDIGIFDKTTTEPILLIEINDNTHNEPRRAYRDIKVKEICNEAEIKLITFYTNYSNKKEYIINRIQNELKN